ncbi:MAG: hypothetical protein ACFFKA_18715, partial [Candidatus Thorarchaeota archaeon]
YNRKYKKLEKRNNGDMEIKKWNLIFGHHSHVPQAVIKSGDGLIAFSGGNFTSPKRWRYHKSGLILRCEIG